MSRDVEAALFVTRDITDRVVAEAERRALESQLRQSQKMQAVGRLAGGIAHDFNNLLTVIQGQISLVTATTPLDPELASSLRAVSDAAERAAALTRQLLTFSRRQVKQPRDIDLAILVRNVAALLPGVLGDDVELEMRIDEAGLLVHADPAMIQQVIFNIAVNAREAMAVGGRLQLSLDRVGQYVRLAINDTGLGISDADLPHVFEPFFTTKEVGQGSGLGLATAFGIIQEHDGHIEVESTVGRGTTIRVLLPAIPGLDGTDAPSAEAPINAIS
jgi:signal transduction histidine kinase